MRVVVPFTDPWPETFEAIEASGFSYEAVDVSDSDEAYWSLLAGLWADGEAFCIVEQDIVVGPETLADLQACGSEWCACPYPYFSGHYPGLGGARFAAGLLRRAPSAMVEVGAMSDSTHSAKHWCRLDGWLKNVLTQKYRARACVHGQVGHLRHEPGTPYPSHGCVRRPA